MTWKKGKIKSTIITSPDEAPEPPSVQTVEVFGGYPIAQDVHPDVINYFIHSKELYNCTKKALLYLKRHPSLHSSKQSENVSLQRQLIKAIRNISSNADFSKRPI